MGKAWRGGRAECYLLGMSVQVSVQVRGEGMQSPAGNRVESCHGLT